MNKLFRIFFYCVLCLINLRIFYAQTNMDSLYQDILSKGKIKTYVALGMNQSTLYGKDLNYVFYNDKTRWLNGFQAGFSMVYAFNKYFFSMHELYYIQKGAGVTLFDSINHAYNTYIKMHYIDFNPINLGCRYKFISVYAGPYLSALADAVIQQKDLTGKFYLNHKIFADPSNFVEKEKYLQKFDYGINVGISFYVRKISLHARYILGFNDIFQYANSYTNNDPKTNKIQIYNKTLFISLGYSIN